MLGRRPKNTNSGGSSSNTNNSGNTSSTPGTETKPIVGGQPPGQPNRNNTTLAGAGGAVAGAGASTAVLLGQEAIRAGRDIAVVSEGLKAFDKFLKNPAFLVLAGGAIYLVLRPKG